MEIRLSQLVLPFVTTCLTECVGLLRELICGSLIEDILDSVMYLIAAT
jgi:hypothetical protein